MDPVQLALQVPYPDGLVSTNFNDFYYFSPATAILVPNFLYLIGILKI